MKDEIKETLAERLEALAGRLTDSGERKIEEASLRDTLTAAGVCVDKAQLLRGKASAYAKDNLLLSELTDEELERRIAEAEGRETAPAVSARPGPVCAPGA